MNSNSPRVGRSLKIGMYLLSLWLLFVLIFVNKIKLEICFDCSFASGKELLEIAAENYLPLICVVLLLISTIFYFQFKFLINGSKQGPKLVESIENKGAEHLVFLATYIIPLVGFALENSRQVINLGITLFILGAIYVKTNLFYANPTLSLLGFKIFGAKVGGRDVILISISDIEVGDAVNFMPLDKNIFFAKKAIRI
jgi:hypothetical protein